VKLLLDTCSFLWALHSPVRLSPAARKALQAPDHTVHVSVVTFWEISLKSGLGKLSVKGADPEDYPALAVESGWLVHPLAPGLAARSGRLPRIATHRDPFDRLLIWTAIDEGFSLVSGDDDFPGYAPHGLKLCW
jgi:PIN domain nuclease of toxin-antitoxin system